MNGAVSKAGGGDARRACPSQNPEPSDRAFGRVARFVQRTRHNVVAANRLSMKLKTQLRRAAVGECSPAAGFLGCIILAGDCGRY